MRMFGRSKAAALRTELRTLGVSVTPAGVGLVALSMREATISVDYTAYASLTEGTPLDALRKCMDGYDGDLRRCVIGLGTESMHIQSFMLNPGNDLRGALELEKERLNRFEGAKQTVVIPAGGLVDERTQVVAFVNTNDVQARVELCSEAGLEARHVDYDGCALGRACEGYDALVIVDGAALTVCGFGKPFVRMRSFGDVNRSTLAVRIGEATGTMVHDGVLEHVRKMAVLADQPTLALLQTSPRLKDITVEPLTIAEEVSPPWALAYGHALYDIEASLDGEVSYAF